MFNKQRAHSKDLRSGLPSTRTEWIQRDKAEELLSFSGWVELEFAPTLLDFPFTRIQRSWGRGLLLIVTARSQDICTSGMSSISPIRPITHQPLSLTRWLCQSVSLTSTSFSLSDQWGSVQTQTWLIHLLNLTDPADRNWVNCCLCMFPNDTTGSTATLQLHVHCFLFYSTTQGCISQTFSDSNHSCSCSFFHHLAILVNWTSYVFRS